MLTSVESQAVHSAESASRLSKAKRFVTRRIWLPKFLYDCLPWFYLTAGVFALLATLYISDWFWILPHYLLFSAGCIHLGAVVFRRRTSGEPMEDRN
jgi:fatty acid desaturase